MTLVFAATPEEAALVTAWMVERIPHMGGGDFGPAVVAGVVRDGELAAGVAFHDWQEAARTLQVSIAGEGAWATRGVFRALFHYAFATAGAEKLWCHMRHDRPDVLKFNKRLGFRREATLRHHLGRGVHAVVASMMRNEWRKSPWYWEA
ncbi:GNAT family N-acetyltransferase [Roseococcus pinisoli]|uniref:GNAT family N-acetyltransferase n=1 Tax=Roseococcus pinisoli TaxID=2835040 RepID=A0ABS5QCE7_9PROT|nr:GNAT family protein [Roseococcus pinisoli]MBS7811209.1 GNAT family N-acetyltransferase [Roseococcus pinisoli]